MDFWSFLTTYVLPVLSILLGLLAMFISIRYAKQSEKTLEEIKNSLDKRVAKSVKSYEDANKFIRENAIKIQTDLIDLIKDSRLPNDQLTSHTKSDVDFIISNLESFDFKFLRACEKYPGNTPRFIPGNPKTPNPEPKAGKRFKDFLGVKSTDEIDESISKLIGYELVDFATNPKKPTERILKFTEKGLEVVEVLRERKLLPD